MEEQILSLLSEISEDPKYKGRANLLGKLRDPAYKDILGKVQSGANIATALAGMIEGSSQKKTAKKALEALKKPELPAAQKVDPNLERLMNKAEMMATSPERMGALDAYKSQIGDIYRSGIEQARTASGGQSGVFGSNTQALYNQRLKQAQSLPQIQDDISARYMGMAGDIAAQKAQAESYAYMNNLNRAQTALNQFNKEADSAADLYRTGAENFYGGMNFGLNAIQNPIADAIYGISNKPTGVPELDTQMNAVSSSMNNRFNNPQSMPLSPYKTTQDQLYGIMTPRWDENKFNQEFNFDKQLF